MYPAFYPELCKTEKAFDFGRNSLISRFLYYFALDEQGIVHLQFTGLGGTARRYFPITAQQYALCQYNMYVQNRKKKNKETFLRHTDWLLQNVKVRNGVTYWPYTWKMRIAGYTWKKPYDWASCIAQGQGLSVLIRAHGLTKNQKYLSPCKRILKSFETDYRKMGGVLETKDGESWYLEFPATVQHGRVLNGFLYALIGLWEYYLYTKDKQAKKLFERGQETAAKNLDRYDLNWGWFKWSRYDDAQIFYSGRRYHHKTLLPQLKILYEITKDERFGQKYRQWREWAKCYAFRSKVLDLLLLAWQKLRAYI
ncbi:MAG TPA: D-glucuronyl C5-epimerase family protein [Candidatus Nanoarchaeia archaeon]|nr:D-glucuronyl C5-epimerase family protein [Candidatus Nanoarchaeia archaeon]